MHLLCIDEQSVHVDAATIGYLGSKMCDNFASDERNPEVTASQKALTPVQISPLCLLKRELVLGKFILEHLQRSCDDQGRMPEVTRADGNREGILDWC